MDDLTVIYFTSNREDPRFERKIQETLMEGISTLPLVSVSQKPIKFGENICVGDIGASPENILKQILIGANEAKTKFVALTEDDFLFPPDYFKFRPQDNETFYYPEEVYLIWQGHATFWRKHLRELLSITNRKHMIKTITAMIENMPSHISNRVKRLTNQAWFKTSAPVVTFKTKRGLHWRSSFSKNNFKKELPYWGTGKDLMGKYL